MKGPILHGKRILLRPPLLSDAKQFVQWFKDKEVVKYLSVQRLLKDLAVERKWISTQIKSPDNILFTIINETGQIIGNTILRLNKLSKVGSLGIVIGAKEQWGKKYAGETIELLANYLFKKLRYNRFELMVAAENHRARRVYEKVGFITEGVKRQVRWNLITKKFEDEVVMSILKKEWLNKK